MYTNFICVGYKYISEFLPAGFSVKQSRKRPCVAQRVPGGLGSQIFKTLST